MINILVTGLNGQLGYELKDLSSQYSQYNFTFTDRTSLDLTKVDAIKDFFYDKNFDVIINCAAYTAVDKAETEELTANLVNHLAVAELAKIAKQNQTSLIHISTDYVFDGESSRPYSEFQTTNPKSVYGKSKAAGEKALFSVGPRRSIIIRTSWVYSSHGKNFVKTMLRLAQQRDKLGVVSDQIGSPTYAHDLAKTILEIIPLIKNEKTEIYHFSNEGVASWYDFAHAIFDIKKIGITLNPISSEEYPLPAPRPNISLLNKSKIKKEFNITIPHWRSSLEKCLSKLNETNLD